MQSLWMIVASLLFACMGVCVKLGSAHFSTGELVFYRGFVGLLLMACWPAGRASPTARPTGAGSSPAASRAPAR
jgi:drug/metabolite transporter (DMT)-like permease